jgi:hypothetical protein
MAAVEMMTDLSNLVDALISGSDDRVIAAARDHLQQNEAADVLLGRIALLAARGDSEGHTVTALGAATMLSRYLHFIPQPLEPDAEGHDRFKEWSRALPLFVQALRIAASAVRSGNTVQEHYPEPFYPSALLNSNKSVRNVMQEAVIKGNTQLVERIILGLYGTGADYRTMQVRTYDGTTSAFIDDGHPLIFAVRGFQILDAVEWGDRAPTIIHWLAPHLALPENASEPSWAGTVRNFVNEHADGLASLRKRLSTPKEESALPLRQLILSNADTAQVCQGVHDAILKGGASPQGTCSVIALTAAELLQRIPDSDHETFARVAHGLLYASAARQALHQTRQVDEMLPLLFFAAAFVNTLYKEAAAQSNAEQAAEPQATAATRGGGFIGVSQLETLGAQLRDNNFSGALTTAQRYLNLRYEPRALFGTIGLAAALTDATTDSGHTLQIVQAASEEFLAWPRTLTDTSIEAFLRSALHATQHGKRDKLIETLA